MPDEGEHHPGDPVEAVGWPTPTSALTPKTVARVARLHHAASLLAGPSPPPWSEVAVRCGYADQPHLNRDFRALTGCTPTDYLTDMAPARR